MIVNGLLMMRKRSSRFEQWVAARFAAALRQVSGAVTPAIGQGFAARVLVGALMGLTPCGLVWMALVPAAAIGNPWLAGAGMLFFGLGTVPALTSVVWMDRMASARWRRHGRVIAAAALIVAGVWISARALPSHTRDSLSLTSPSFRWLRTTSA